MCICDDHVVTGKHFSHYLFLAGGGIHRFHVDSRRKGPVVQSLEFPWLCAWNAVEQTVRLKAIQDASTPLWYHCNIVKYMYLNPPLTVPFYKVFLIREVSELLIIMCILITSKAIV